MTLLELAAVLLGLVNITLLVRRSIWNFPFGIAMVTAYLVIFWRQRLYAEAGLQVFFVVVQIYGWRLWARAGGIDTAVAVRSLGTGARIACLGFVALGTVALGWSLGRFTDAAAPYPDAAIAAGSIAAQLLLAYRRIENWALWIAIDAGAIALFITRGLTLTAGLYAAFLALSAVGLVQWKRAMASQRESDA